MSKSFTIDINADVGEGLDNEEMLFPYISSCNIACGGHAGNNQTMSKVIDLAVSSGIKIGAHPSYPDKQNFGRKSLVIGANRLRKSVIAQILNLKTLLNAKGQSLHHVKPHGALYNDIAKNEKLALVFLEAMQAFKEAIIYVPYGSVVEKLAKEQGFKVEREAFLDRKYHDDLRLVARNQAGSVLHAPEEVLAQALSILTKKEVPTLENKDVAIEAETYCIHGDNKAALDILKYLHQAFEQHNISLS